MNESCDHSTRTVMCYNKKCFLLTCLGCGKRSFTKGFTYDSDGEWFTEQSTPLLPKWTDLETAWLAGLLEGEGCFSLHPGRGKRVYARVSMCSTDRDIVTRACTYMNTRLYAANYRRRPSHYKDKFQTYCVGVKAIEVMNRILPYMGERRSARILEVIRLNATVRTGAPELPEEPSASSHFPPCAP
jgi:hypothetical protein